MIRYRKKSRGQTTLKQQNYLPLAALLHDIGKFRQRATERNTKHQEHSYEFVTQDFPDFFAPCGDIFKNAIRNHHTDGHNLIEKQVILADRLSATEREGEERGAEDFVQSPLVSIPSRFKGADKDKEYRYKLTALNFDRDAIIPTETAGVDQKDYADLWKEFTDAFCKVTEGKTYAPAHYQTIVALLRKYTSRMPSATPWEKSEVKTIPDISLYDHLRTTAAIAACIRTELTNADEIDELLANPKESERNICALIKGDISGIQDFLYHILSDGAANQLRGRSFYLQLLTEAMAHWVLKQLDLPITNLILASGGHFYILAPYTAAKEKLDTLCQQISQKLWELHSGSISCILADISIKANDFTNNNFSNKWDAVAERVNERKQQKWSDMGNETMFQNLFEPYESKEINWKFDDLGKQLRNAEYLITHHVTASNVSENPYWHDAIKMFGLDIHICTNMGDIPSQSPVGTENTVVYRIGSIDFLNDDSQQNFQLENTEMSYDFRIFHPVIARTKEEETADYDYLANASEGVNWFGALRMDVDDLSTVFKDKLENATISRHATLSREMKIFFEGYVPYLCKEHNKNRDREILELIYAGGDDLFLVGGWSALPEIAEQIRSEFRHFITGDHVTLSGGIAIEHMKFPLYQFADMSGDAEKDAKNIDDNKNAITFLRKPMKWEEFADVRKWHQKFLNVLTGRNQLPRDFLTRLSQIYSEKELKQHRWAWRSLYYFHRLQARYKYDEQKDFLRELKQELNHQDSSQFREELIHVITRWTALRIRNR